MIDDVSGGPFYNEEGYPYWITKYDTNYFLIKSENRRGLIDINGYEVIEPYYDDIDVNTDRENYMESGEEYSSLPIKDVIKVTKNGLSGIVNIKNKISIPCIYDRIKYMSDSSLSVVYIEAENKGLKGIFNKELRPIIDIKYIHIESQKNHFIAWTVNGEKLFFDSLGIENYPDLMIFTSQAIIL